jgi:type III pantothenate kinase
MMLLLDIGNTRIKAGCLRDGDVEFVGQAEYRGVPIATVIGALGLPESGIDHIVACCVGGTDVRDDLSMALRGRYGVMTSFVRATPEACGVTNAYPEPGRLGADRWAALIGAHARGYSPACIVDAGSALTVDGLVDGQHLGGLIIPGVDMMQQALFEKTGDLRSLSEAPLPGGQALFATDTREAIVRGSLVAAASIVRGARRELAQRLGRAPTIVLMGGDADRVLALLDEDVVHVPNLILEGLARLAAAGDGAG